MDASAHRPLLVALVAALLGLGADLVLSPGVVSAGLHALAFGAVALVVYQQQRLHRAALERQRAAERTMRSVLDAAPDAMLVCDPSGRVHLASARAEELLGGSDLIGRSVEEFVPEELREAHLARRAGLGDTDAARPMGIGRELVARRLDGTRVPVEISLAPVVLEGERRFVVGLRDVTERQRLSEQLRQTQKMDALGRLAGGLSHDLNNLLTIMLSFARFAREGANEPELREDVDQVIEAAERARALTGQLLAFARPQVVQPRALDLRELVSNAEGLYGRVLGADIAVEGRAARDLWSTCGDRGQIEQVLMNLVMNARDAMPRGGTLRIEAENRVRDVSDGPPYGEWVVLSVTDTGVGMSPEVRERMFEPFFTTKAEKGTGLGLSMVFSLVRQAGGHVMVSSRVGVGTRVELLLPRAEDELDEPTGPTGDRATSGGRETVLVVEDEPAIRRVAVRTLRRAGYHVLEASDGEDALGVARGTSLDLLVTDIRMPRLDGRELVERLRTDDPGLRVLFTSGFSDGAIVHTAAFDPRRVFLPKPFAPDDLLLQVRALLDAEVEAAP